MRKDDKYSQGRRAMLTASICLTAVFLPLVLFGLIGVGILGVIVFFWVAYFLVKNNADKNYDQAKSQYNGDLGKALRDCTDCTDEYAILDQGIYSYYTGKLSLFENISHMEPAYIAVPSRSGNPNNDNVQIEMAIYENGVLTSSVVFRTKKELEDFAQHIEQLTNNRFPIKGFEYGSTQRDLDDISRKIFGDVKMTPSKQADDPTKDSADKDKVIF